MINSAGEIWQKAILPINASIHQAITTLDIASTKIVMVIDGQGRLIGTISDGDIRRGLLKGLNLDSQILDIVHRNAFVVPPELGREMVLQLMLANKIQQIPVVDGSRVVIGMHSWDEITAPTERPNLMVIMAGGKGTRLRPYTENCPKPMVSVAGKPILEHIIGRAKLEGFKHFVISLNYLGHMIEDYLGNGEALNVRVDYLREDSPLGTAGALQLLNPCPEIPFVVSNGDVITDIRYGELLDFHIFHSAVATMAVRSYEWQNPFGVVETQGIDITRFNEKPIIHSHINAGVYVLDPGVLSSLESNSYCDMPSLFERERLKGGRVVAYPMHEPWLDVGKPEDLKLATDFLKI